MAGVDCADFCCAANPKDIPEGPEADACSRISLTPRATEGEGAAPHGCAVERVLGNSIGGGVSVPGDTDMPDNKKPDGILVVVLGRDGS